MARDYSHLSELTLEGAAATSRWGRQKREVVMCDTEFQRYKPGVSRMMLVVKAALARDQFYPMESALKEKRGAFGSGREAAEKKNASKERRGWKGSLSMAFTLRVAMNYGRR